MFGQESRWLACLHIAGANWNAHRLPSYRCRPMPQSPFAPHASVLQARQPVRCVSSVLLSGIQRPSIHCPAICSWLGCEWAWHYSLQLCMCTRSCRTCQCILPATGRWRCGGAGPRHIRVGEEGRPRGWRAMAFSDHRPGHMAAVSADAVVASFLLASMPLASPISTLSAKCHMPACPHLCHNADAK